MSKSSAGLLLFRRGAAGLEVLLVHPGGPFWSRKDLGAWSIPKGEIAAGEDPLAAARREVAEELGRAVDGRFHPLPAVKQRGGKLIAAWAVETDFDPAELRSNKFLVEWPPRSGKQQEFPEVDRAIWFALPEARARMNPAQVPLLDALAELLVRK